LVRYLSRPNLNLRSIAGVHPEGQAARDLSFPVRILIVCEIRLYREGLALLVGAHGSVQSVAEVADVAGAFRAMSELRPDVVLLDGAMPDGIENVLAIVREDPAARVVVLGASEREHEVIGYAEAGVSGYVTRDASASTLCETVRAVAHGETLCTPQIAATLLRRVAVLALQQAEPDATRLTTREREVVALVGRGLTNREIADHLYIEAATVKNHVHRILAKLEVQRRGDIAGAWSALQRR
jgi:two-component system, NarL family, nitrate/nitrite response regulator NarL